MWSGCGIFAGDAFDFVIFIFDYILNRIKILDVLKFQMVVDNFLCLKFYINS